MNLKKGFFWFLFFLLCGNLSYGGELIYQEALTHFNEGVKAQKAKKFLEATDFYQKAILMDPSNINLKKFITNNRGVIFVQQGDLEKAEAAFNEVLKIDPDYEPAKLNLGLIYDKKQNKVESIEYWFNLFDIQKLKPKDFIIEEEQKIKK